MRVALVYHTCELCENELVEMLVFNNENQKVYNLFLRKEELSRLRDDCEYALHELEAKELSR